MEVILAVAAFALVQAGITYCVLWAWFGHWDWWNPANDDK
jgi:hypothetical protein